MVMNNNTSGRIAASENELRQSSSSLSKHHKKETTTTSGHPTAISLSFGGVDFCLTPDTNDSSHNHNSHNNENCRPILSLVGGPGNSLSLKLESFTGTLTVRPSSSSSSLSSPLFVPPSTGTESPSNSHGANTTASKVYVEESPSPPRPSQKDKDEKKEEAAGPAPPGQQKLTFTTIPRRKAKPIHAKTTKQTSLLPKRGKSAQDSIHATNKDEGKKRKTMPASQHETLESPPTSEATATQEDGGRAKKPKTHGVSWKDESPVTERKADEGTPQLSQSSVEASDTEEIHYYCDDEEDDDVEMEPPEGGEPRSPETKKNSSHKTKTTTSMTQTADTSLSLSPLLSVCHDHDDDDDDDEPLSVEKNSIEEIDEVLDLKDVEAPSPMSKTIVVPGEPTAAPPPPAPSPSTDESEEAGVDSDSSSLLDPRRRRKAKANPDPTARWGHTMTRIDKHRVVVYGGQAYQTRSATNRGPSSSDLVTLSDLQVYDLKTQKWSTPTNCESVARAWHSATYLPHGSKIISFGGESVHPRSGRVQTSDEIHVLDCELLLWYPPTVTGTTPSGRSGHSASLLLRDWLVVFGGVKNRKWLNTLACLDTERWTWCAPKVLGDAPRPRSYHSATTISSGARGRTGRVVIFGGNNGATCFNSVHVLEAEPPLDGKSIAWRWFHPNVSGTAPAPRTGHSATLLDDDKTILIHGGWDPCADDENDNDDDDDESGEVIYQDSFLLDTELWTWKPHDSVATTTPETVPKQRVGHETVLVTKDDCNPDMEEDPESHVLAFGGRIPHDNFTSTFLKLTTL